MRLGHEVGERDVGRFERVRAGETESDRLSRRTLGGYGESSRFSLAGLVGCARVRQVSLIPPETVEQIIAANDIVEVVEGYIRLKRSGTVYKAPCPFHQERTPSFTVNPQRQIFKCFGCGAGGNVIRFVMSYENLDFVAAVKKLAERVNIPIQQAEMSAEAAAQYSMKRRLLALHAEVADFFHYQLMKKLGAQIARDYLKGRGISVEVAKSWKIGYAPDAWDTIRDFAHEQGYSDEEIIKSGLVSFREQDDPGSGFYDRFRGRLMFPISDVNNNVIAFSGRVLEKDAFGGKYVNSPETMLFTKGAVLFGLNKSMRALLDKRSAIVCEGQLDLITAFEHGVQNVIAPQGTAFTDKQAHILKRYVDEVVLCFDADTAGDNAAEKSLPHLLAESLAVRVVTMPQGEDPDSLIRGQGAGAFTERVAAAKDFFEFQIDRLAKQPEFATARGKMQAARKMAESISLIKDAILRETVMNKVTQRLEVSTQEFVRLLKAPVEKKDDPEVPAPSASPQLADPTIRLLATVALRDAAAREWLLEEHWDRMLADDPDAALLSKILEAQFDPADSTSIHVFLTTLSAEEESVVSGLLADKPAANPLHVAHDCWRELERRQIRRRMESLKARQRTPGLAYEEQVPLHEEILALQKRFNEIAGPIPPPA
jgi:DNA primase